MKHGRWLLATWIAALIGLGAVLTAAALARGTAAVATATTATALTGTTPVTAATPSTATPTPVSPKPAFRQVMGSPFPTGAGPTAVAFSRDGRFLAVADYQLNAVGIYAVSERGALHRVPGSPFPTGSGPVALAFSPTGHTLLVADLGADELTVDALSATGGLTPERRPYPLAGPPYDVTYSPNGRVIATADSTGDAFELIASTPTGAPGAAKTALPLASGSDPTSIAFSPNGGLFAVAEHGTAAVDVYRVNGTGSLPTLTPLSGSPASTAAPVDTVSFNRESSLLAASDYNAGQVDLVRTSAAGISSATVGAIQTGPGSGPDSAGFSPVADRLAVALGTGNETAVYQVLPAAIPSPLTGSPLHAGTGPAALAFNPQGTLLATANIYSNSVNVYASTAPPPTVIRLTTGRATVRHHRVLIRVNCAGIVDRSPGHVCRGSVTLQRQGVRLSRARFTLAPGTGATLSLSLPRQLLGLTTHHRRLALLERAEATGAHSISRRLSISG